MASPAKSTIVTGSSRGIGKAIALRLAKDGHSICINDIPANQSGIDEVVSEIRAAGGTATGYAADVSSLSQMQDLVAHSVAELGELTCMVANAGIAQVKPLLELTEEDLRRMFEVNVFGVYNSYRAAAEQMIRQGKGGKLIGCASIVAFKPFPLLSHYSSSKWAVRGLTQAMAMEMADHKISVNAYAPGIVGTAMWDLIDEKLAEKAGKQKGEMIQKYVNELTAMKRTSVPEDLAGLLSFLVGPDSDFMTGQTVVCDGGIIYT